MSKMDDLRAMREAKYAKNNARPAAPAARRTAPIASARPAEPADTGALCGHSSINGRTCTREAGHAAKSHRYS